MAQTSYSAAPSAYAEGVPADSGASDFVSAVAEEEIPFGNLVVRGASAGGCALPGSSADVTGGNVLGIAIADTSIETADGASYGAYPIKSRVRIMRLGRCSVKFGDTVSTGAGVYVRFAGGDEGKFRSDSDDTDGSVSDVEQTGAGPAVTITGTPATDGDGLITVTATAGARGTARFNWSYGAENASNVLTAATVVLGTTGLTAHFATGTYVEAEEYSWTGDDPDPQAALLPGARAFKGASAASIGIVEINKLGA